MKKIIAIILVVAMLVSCTACGETKPTQTETPVVTPVPQTPAPTAEPTPAPTVEPTVEPTEAPKDDYVYLKPTAGLSDNSSKVLEWDGKADIDDGYYKITMSDTATEVTYADGNFAGTLYIYGGSEENTTLVVDMPNAHVEFFGKAKEVTATTSANTFVAKSTSTIAEKLTVASGNATIENATPAVIIPETNTSKTTITTTNEAAPVVTNNSEGTVVVTEDDSKVTISGDSAAATYVKQNSTVKAEVTDKENAETSAQLTQDEVIIPANPTITVGDGETVNTVTDAVVVEKPEVESTELTVDDVKNGVVPFGYTLTIKADETVETLAHNYGTIAVADEAGLRLALSVGGMIELSNDIQASVNGVNGNDKAAFIIGENANVTIDGKGNKITATGTVISSGNFISVNNSAKFTIKNITLIDGSIDKPESDDTKVQYLKTAINTYLSGDVVIDNVTIQDFGAYGIIANGSNVVANNVDISGCGWGCVNVDPGSGVKVASVFTLLGDSVLTPNAGTAQIKTDGTHVGVADEKATTTVNADGYAQIQISKIACYYTNKAVEITSASTSTTTGKIGYISENVTITKDFQVVAGSVLVIPYGKTLTIAEGVKLDIQGEISIIGTLRNNGTAVVYDSYDFLNLLAYNTSNSTLQLGCDIMMHEDYLGYNGTSTVRNVVYGTIDGAGYTIYDLENEKNNSALAKLVYDFTIKNVMLDIENCSVPIFFFSYDGSEAKGFTAENVETFGDMDINSGGTNIAPLLSSSLANTTRFINCTNYSNIKCDEVRSYGSAFLGGYILYSASTPTVIFDNCTNYGDIAFSHAGVFIGNGSNINNVNLQMLGNNANYGDVVGYSNVAYFAPIACTSTAQPIFEAAEKHINVNLSSEEAGELMIVNFEIPLDVNDKNNVVIEETQEIYSKYSLMYQAYSSLKSGGSYLFTWKNEIASTGETEYSADVIFIDKDDCPTDLIVVRDNIQASECDCVYGYTENGDDVQYYLVVDNEGENFTFDAKDVGNGMTASVNIAGMNSDGYVVGVGLLS